MPGLDELRALKAKYPAYKNASDAEFALAVHEQFYKDEGVPLDIFLRKNGLDPNTVRKEVSPDSPFGKYLSQSDADAKVAAASTSPTGEENVGIPEGIIRSAGQGLTFGFGDELAGAWNALTGSNPNSPDYWAKMGERYKEAQAAETRKLKAFEKEHPWIAGASEITGSFVPGLLAAPFTGGGSLAPTIGRAALMSGIGGGIYGYGKAEDPNDPNALFSWERAQAAIPSAVIGAGAGALGSKVASMVKPTEVDDVVASAAKTLENAGVTSLTAGQKTGNAAVQDLERRGGQKIKDMLLDQKKQFASVVWNDLGIKQLDDLTGGAVITAPLQDISKPTMQAAKQVYDNAYATLKSFPIIVDANLINNIDNVTARFGGYSAGMSGGLTDLGAKVLSTISKIKAAYRGGVVAADGKLYEQLYKDLGKAISKADDYPTRQALRELQESLNEALREGISRSAVPDAEKAAAETILDTLRSSRQKFFAVQDAAKARLDNKFIDPKKLLRAVGKYDPEAVETGVGNLAVLAELSEAASTVGTKLATLPPPSIPARYTVPGVVGSSAALLTPADPLTRGIVGAAAFGGSELARRGIQGLEGRLAASNIGQSVLANEAPSWLTGLTTGTGVGIAAAAPYAGQATSDMFGLGDVSQTVLP